MALNALLDAEADRLCGAGRYERTQGRQDTRAGSYERSLHTVAGEVNLKVRALAPDLQDGHHRVTAGASSVEEALIEKPRRRCFPRRSVLPQPGGCGDYGTSPAQHGRPNAN
jgi:hypothetical protein